MLKIINCFYVIVIIIKVQLLLKIYYVCLKKGASSHNHHQSKLFIVKHRATGSLACSDMYDNNRETHRNMKKLEICPGAFWNIIRHIDIRCIEMVQSHETENKV